jgi:hydroxyacylglutathione hydrolase
MNYIVIPVGCLETNCYLVYSENSKECAIIDPGEDAVKIIDMIERHFLDPIMIINTHGHFDHVGANKDVKDNFNIPLLIHPFDVPMLEMAKEAAKLYGIEAENSPPPDRLIHDGDIIEIGKDSLTVIHSPGHSPGSISLYQEGILFSGDTLFCRGVGRTDIPGGSWEILKSSIKNQLFTLPENTLVLPGHGPKTYIGQEKKLNPFII